MNLIMMAAALVLASVTIVSPLAGAFEVPGDASFSADRYVAIGGLYYPGFTIAGVAEPLAILALGVLLASVARETWPFWLIALALAAEALSHLLYWVLIAPVNGLLLAGDARPAPAEADRNERIALRERWELSHVCRALASTLAFVLLVAATLASAGSL
ncbi:uncharacterized protein DUF1772 [Roseiarcus fermentans]|uniref:Uncharacterized protein DUF1772 n=1 Tax=Roseiarcus fermentans TaxID=1473586 RepID=A0A366FGP0_9HYPH|nr:anthrone oxygenase family protein [Roseiarcus fermentans]RBP12895.1 uncharacterized protein DUF1772 [Roseiarcus fermentans]